MEYLAVASRLAQDAARLIMSLCRESLSRNHKEDRSLLTEADLLSDRLLREGLSEAFPQHTILTEENEIQGAPDAEWVWLVDPLDGTNAYAKGIAGFSILVGLLKAGQPHLGVIVDPLEGLVYEAIRGEGAFIMEGGKRRRLQVSRRSDCREMPLITTTSFPEELLKKIVRRLETPVCQPLNSVGIKVGLVVRQVADIYLNHHPVHYWDTCAPQVILEEAGGRITGLDGKPLEYRMATDSTSHPPTLCTNGTKHSEIVALLRNLIPT